MTSDARNTILSPTSERSPAKAPPSAPTFTFHIHAVLDKKFNFKQERDGFLLCYDGGFSPLRTTQSV